MSGVEISSLLLPSLFCFHLFLVFDYITDVWRCDLQPSILPSLFCFHLFLLFDYITDVWRWDLQPSTPFTVLLSFISRIWLYYRCLALWSPALYTPFTVLLSFISLIRLYYRCLALISQALYTPFTSLLSYISIVFFLQLTANMGQDSNPGRADLVAGTLTTKPLHLTICSFMYVWCWVLLPAAPVTALLFIFYSYSITADDWRWDIQLSALN